MTTAAREVWITGVGLLSALGEGRDTHLDALADPAAILAARDSARFAPYHIHPIRAFALDRFMPRRGDQRAMGPWMHYGVHAAGLALTEAGVLGDPALLARTHVHAAAAGGERDTVLDQEILAALADPGAAPDLLNRKLTEGLRPTAFLAQLSNMFAGNLSIVLGVAGSSRTFMGEEPAGIEAVRVAWRRVQAGQGDLFLVAASYNAEREDTLLLHQSGGRLLKGPWRGLWDRPSGGVALGSMGAALVLEAADHARARGASPVARLAGVSHGWSGRDPGMAAKAAGPVPEGVAHVISGASGAAPITQEEHAFLASHRPTLAARGIAAAIGHGIEAAFPATLAIAAWCCAAGRLPPPLDADAVEAPAEGMVRRIAATSWGVRRGEGLGIVEAV